MATIFSFSGDKNHWADVSIILNAIISVPGSLEGAGRFIYNLVKVSRFFEGDTPEISVLFWVTKSMLALLKAKPLLRRLLWHSHSYEKTHHQLSISRQLCIFAMREMPESRMLFWVLAKEPCDTHPDLVLRFVGVLIQGLFFGRNTNERVTRDCTSLNPSCYALWKDTRSISTLHSYWKAE